ncbi:MAG: DegT/DnrJ/EryC1/StrS aminotransferase family protein [Syntrophales bacterium]|nr:DegT/DnrJ/EryC1/StrS aminotransferase family protein [Syntrophales bacterium]MDD5640731.1 DegT/DnrJ/EryC1/StrS aminotransferase family protein [Syntrophales bacterium]
MAAWKVPLADLQFGPEEIEAVTQVLQSGWISQGPKVQQFEAEFAQFLGVEHALAVANGTAAMHLACMALGLGPGDEVLCPSLTFVATANAIRYTGAQPCFVDIVGLHDLNLSPTDAACKITPRTKAIMVVHYAGFAADMRAIEDMAAQHGLAIIEDCAHAPGAVYPSPPGNQKVGSRGSSACFSFFSNKNLTTGEGGMVVTNDPALAERLRVTRSHGMTTLTWDRHRGHSFSYDVVAPGYNYRLDEMRAALGLVQLSRLMAGNARRRELTNLYRQKLGELPQVQLPFLSANLEASACHLFPVLLRAEVDRAQFMSYLAEHGIQTSIHYPPIHKFSYYRQLWPPVYDHRLPHTEDIAAREVTLPLYPSMTNQQLAEVAGAIRDFFRKE